MKEIVIKELTLCADAAIIVPDDGTKVRLQKNLKEDDDERNLNILTVEDCKGIDYKYVLCFNMISGFKDQWDDILKKGGNVEETYRLVFNKLYVAITRAKDYLSFIDENNTLNVENFLKWNLVVEDEYNEKNLHFSELDKSLEAWIEKATEYKSKENYEKAYEIMMDVAKRDAQIIKKYEKDFTQVEVLYYLSQMGDYKKALSIAIKWWINSDDKSILEDVLSEPEPNNSNIRKIVKEITKLDNSNDENFFGNYKDWDYLSGLYNKVPTLFKEIDLNNDEQLYLLEIILLRHNLLLCHMLEEEVKQDG